VTLTIEDDESLLRNVGYKWPYDAAPLESPMTSLYKNQNSHITERCAWPQKWTNSSVRTRKRFGGWELH